jgi:hypothetical protein
MKRLLMLVLSVGLLAQPASINAQQPYFFSGIPDDTEYLDFLSGSGVSGGYGVQVGPYTGRFTTPTSPLFSIYCVDYNHYAKDQRVKVTALAMPIGTNTRLDSFVKYQKAAYLASLFDPGTDVYGATGGGPNGIPDSQNRWGGIHAAIWYITSGVMVGDAAQREYYLGLATAHASSFDTRGWYVLSPLNASGGRFDGTGQEFLMRTVSVPEPASFVLLASGLLFLAALSRKKVKWLEQDA